MNNWTFVNEPLAGFLSELSAYDLSRVSSHSSV